MNSVVCFHCERPGHMVRDCPDKIKLCYNCSTVGHLARDCPEPPKKRIKPDSPKKQSTNSTDSTKNDKACFICGSLEHLKQNCPKRTKPTEVKETENGNDDKKSTKEEKTEASGVVDKKSCWECGKTGHIARECPNPSESFKRKSRPPFDGPDRRRGSRDDACFRCGELGHFAKDCTGFHQRRPPSPRSPMNTEVYDVLNRALNKAKRDLCYVCGMPGHFARECPRNNPTGPGPFANIQPPPNGPFRGGGGGIGGGGGGSGGDCGPNFMPMQSIPQFNENMMVPEGLNVNNPCLTCGRNSHVTFDCPIAKLCYRCGMTNHIAKDCAGMGSMMNRDRMMSMERFSGPPPNLQFNSMNGEDRMKADERCFRCGGRGHKSFECSQEKACYRCGRRDHEARDCFDVNNTCYKCGKTGHMTYNCDMMPSSGARMMGSRSEDGAFGDTKCYRCGRVGHTARDCPQEKVCYKCNREGHIARECPREEFNRDGNRFRSSDRNPWIDF